MGSFPSNFKMVTALETLMVACSGPTPCRSTEGIEDHVLSQLTLLQQTNRYLSDLTPGDGSHRRKTLPGVGMTIVMRTETTICKCPGRTAARGRNDFIFA